MSKLNSWSTIKRLSDFLKETKDLNTLEPEPIGDKKGYYKLEGTTEKSGDGEFYIIYDCSGDNAEFDFLELNRVKKADENFSSIIVIFKNWDHERELFFKAQKELTNRKSRATLDEIYSQKISYYIDIDNEIDIPVDGDGINFLEYMYSHKEDNLKKIELNGFIYNVSMSELKEVFNVTGINLFSKNVRYGLSKDKTGKKLKENFKMYMKVKCIMNYKKDGQLYKSLSTLFNIDKQALDYNQPEQFWFYHNGITIFSYDSKSLDRTGETVKINPRKISVINGAQTLTQFFTGMEEMNSEVDNLVENIEDLDGNQLVALKEELKALIKDASKDIFVKAIFIEGNEENVKVITSGLNTQIPIMEEDQIADDNVVVRINENLKSNQIKILKGGENPGSYTGVKVLDFVKLYLVTKMKPGESKNFQKKKLVETIKEIERDLEEENTKMDLLDKLNQALIVDIWWKKRPREERENYRELDSYGKNYFQSFVINEVIKSKESIDEELLIQLYNKFIKVFNQENLDDGTFKTDELFVKYLNGTLSTIQNLVDKSIRDIDKDDLIRYINENRKSNYSVSNTITKYLNDEGIVINYFRVIPVKNKKVKESYPFPNSTFNELYQWDGYPDDDRYKKFSDSKFLEELRKTYPVFIVFWEYKATSEINGNLEEKKELVSGLEIIEDFSFMTFKKEAQKVYEETVEAFCMGKESLFPKISDDLKFHVRPKAVNAEDTFEFSNGDLLTKRTFWANSKTIEELINEKREDIVFQR